MANVPATNLTDETAAPVSQIHSTARPTSVCSVTVRIAKSGSSSAETLSGRQCGNRTAAQQHRVARRPQTALCGRPPAPPAQRLGEDDDDCRLHRERQYDGKDLRRVHLRASSEAMAALSSATSAEDIRSVSITLSTSDLADPRNSRRVRSRAMLRQTAARVTSGSYT